MVKKVFNFLSPKNGDENNRILKLSLPKDGRENSVFSLSQKGVELYIFFTFRCEN